MEINNTINEAIPLLGAPENAQNVNDVNVEVLQVADSEMSYGEISREAIKLGAPLFFNACVMGVANFGSAMIIGNIDSNTLAASPYIFASQMLPALTGSVIHSVGMLSAIGYGAKEYKKIGSILRNGQILGLVLSIPSMGVIWYIKPIVELIGCPQSLAVIVEEYGHVFIGAVPLISLAIPSKIFLESIGQPKITALSDLCAVIPLLGGGAAFSYGLIGFPKLGAQGLAVGTILQFATINLVSEAYLFTQRNQYGIYNFLEPIRDRLQVMKEILKEGYPFIFLASGHIAANYLNLIMVTQFGETALAAQNIATHYEALLGIPMFSLTNSASILLGQSFGAKRYLSLRRLYDIGLGGALLYSGAALSAFTLFPDEFTSFFLWADPQENNPELFETLRPLYIATFISMLEKAIDLMSFMALKGLGNIHMSTAISIGSRWVLNLPLSAIFGFALNLGVVGLMIGNDMGLLIGAITLMGYWMHTLNEVLKNNCSQAEYQQHSYSSMQKAIKLLSPALAFCSSSFFKENNRLEQGNFSLSPSDTLNLVESPEVEENQNNLGVATVM